MRKRFLKFALIILCVLFVPPVVLRLVPFPELAEFCAQEYSCRIYDRRGELIQVTAIGGGGRREFTPIKKIPKQIQKTFIQQEDKRFYFHHGVDWLAILRAAVQNKQAERIVSGGSTITMQLAKLANQDNSLTLRRKLKDIFNAYRIEAKLSKKKILELYLNSIYFGSNSYGITSAARTYFSCELNQLTNNQLIPLSTIPRSPNYIVPANAKYYTYPLQFPHFVNYLTAQAHKSVTNLP